MNLETQQRQRTSEAYCKGRCKIWGWFEGVYAKARESKGEKRETVKNVRGSRTTAKNRKKFTKNYDATFENSENPIEGRAEKLRSSLIYGHCFVTF